MRPWPVRVPRLASSTALIMASSASLPDAVEKISGVIPCRGEEKSEEAGVPRSHNALYVTLDHR